MSFYQVVTLCVVGGLLAAGDFFMKSWAEHHSHFQSTTTWYLLAMVLYITGLSIYGYTLRSVDFAAASYGILLFNMIFVAVVGYAYFGDTLSITEGIAILLGISSVVFFMISSK